jgi:hypothetical protein
MLITADALIWQLSIYNYLEFFFLSHKILLNLIIFNGLCVSYFILNQCLNVLFKFFFSLTFEFSQ